MPIIMKFVGNGFVESRESSRAYRSSGVVRKESLWVRLQQGVLSAIDSFEQKLHNFDEYAHAQLIKAEKAFLGGNRNGRKLAHEIRRFGEPQGWDALKTEDLIGRTTNYEVRDRNGDTPLLAAVRSGYLWAAEELIKRGASLNARDARGNTVLQLAEQVAYDFRTRGHHEQLQKAAMEKLISGACELRTNLEAVVAWRSAQYVTTNPQYS